MGNAGWCDRAQLSLWRNRVDDAATFAGRHELPAEGTKTERRHGDPAFEPCIDLADPATYRPWTVNRRDLRLALCNGTDDQQTALEPADGVERDAAQGGHTGHGGKV